MASKVLNALAILVQFATVYWKSSNNFRSQGGYGKMDDIRNSLAEREWVDTYPVSVTAISDEERDECLKERQTQWDVLKAANTADAAVERQMFEKLYVENGKLIKPLYSGNAGFRRASVYFSAMVQRFKGKDAPAIAGTVPVFVKEYKDPTDRIIDQQMENELRNVGAVEVPALDKLRVTKRLFELGCREIKIRQLYQTSTTAQKLFGICNADLHWPTLKIFDRFYLPVDHPDHIPFGPVRHDDLVSMNNRYEADVLRKEGKPLNDKQRQMSPITEKEVEDYFRDRKQKRDQGNADKIMTKKDIEQGAKSNKIGFFRLAMQAVVDNKVTPMIPYMDHDVSLNLHKELIDTGKGAAVEAALTLTKEHDSLVKSVKATTVSGHADLIALVCELSDSGKAEQVKTALLAVKNQPANNGSGAISKPIVPAVKTPVTTGS